MQKPGIILREVKEAAKYYAANKEALREDARKKYRNLSKEKKDKKGNIKKKDTTRILI